MRDNVAIGVAGAGSLAEAIRGALTESGMPEPRVRLIGAGDRGGALRDEELHKCEIVIGVRTLQDAEELAAVEAGCRQGGKRLIPVVRMGSAALIGPTIPPGLGTGWKTLWRSLHEPTLAAHAEPVTVARGAESLVANLVARQAVRAATGMVEEEANAWHWLDLATLESQRHAVCAIKGTPTGRSVGDVDRELERDLSAPRGHPLEEAMRRWTSPLSGLFHFWGEADLPQLPIPLCLVRPVDPCSEGPAALLPDVVGGGLTHEEAAREAGLGGIEAIADRLMNRDRTGSGCWLTGAGITVGEAIERSLQRLALARLSTDPHKCGEEWTVVRPDRVMDERCRHYLRMLSLMGKEPACLAAGKAMNGIPAAGVKVEERWLPGTGWSDAAALRRALTRAMMEAALDSEDGVDIPIGLSQQAAREESSQASIGPAPSDAFMAGWLRRYANGSLRNTAEIEMRELSPELEPFAGNVRIYAVRIREKEA